MESPVTKENHLLVTYGGIFVIVLIAKKKEFLKKIILEERKNLPSKYSKKDMKQEIQKLTSLENPLESLIITFFILEPESKRPFLPHHVQKIMIKIWNLHWFHTTRKSFPKYQKNQSFSTNQTQT